MSAERTSLHALRVFEAISRHRSVKLAAHELNVTPSAASQQLGMLEDSLGLRLFDRVARRLLPTAEAVRLADRLAAAFSQIDNALSEARASTAPHVLRLRLAPTFAARWLMPRLSSFVGKHPALHVELSTNISQGNEPGLDGVDFAIRLVARPAEGEDGLLLFRDALCPVCTPAMAKRIKAEHDLTRLPLLHSMLREDSWRRWADSAGCTLPLHGGPRFSTAELAYQAALEGVGVAIAQLTYVQPELRSGRLVTPMAHVATSELGYFLVNAAHKRDWPKVRSFRMWMIEQVENSALHS